MALPCRNWQLRRLGQGSLYGKPSDLELTRHSRHLVVNSNDLGRPLRHDSR
jgi:hypothetical protein